MAVDEASRLHLYEQARNAWGGDAADTLMHALPWDPDRSATKDDLAVLSANLRAEMADIRGELKADIATSTRTMIYSTIVSNATMAGLILAAVKLA